MIAITGVIFPLDPRATAPSEEPGPARTPAPGEVGIKLAPATKWSSTLAQHDFSTPSSDISESEKMWKMRSFLSPPSPGKKRRSFDYFKPFLCNGTDS
jgi:hypothetical protein